MHRTGLALTAAALLSGCGWRGPQWRTYEEISFDAGTAAEHTHTAGIEPTLKWTAPDGWRESPGSGMRLASFSVQRGGATGLCTIVTLGGAAGGLEANVLRWLGQLQLPVPPAPELASFLARQQRVKSEGGFDGAIVDLTELGDPAPETSSMIAAQLTLDNSTLFVKLTGPVSLLRGEKASLSKLCASIRMSP